MTASSATTEPTQEVLHRTLQGTVVRDAMNKSVVVEVRRFQSHPKYKKRYTTSERFVAHDEKNAYVVGDVVEIRACRPLSKTKRWFVSRKLDA